MSRATRRKRWAIYRALARMSGRSFKAVVNGDINTLNAIEIHVNRLHAQLNELRSSRSGGGGI